MIELGYGQREKTFKTGRNWMASVGDSPFSCLPRRGEISKEIQGILTSELLIDQFLGATSSPNVPCEDVTDGPKNKYVLPSSIMRYLLEIIKEKAGFRHSLMSLLPTEIQDPTNCYNGYENPQSKNRYRSCEPQTKDLQVKQPIFSSFFLERLLMNRQRKRLSLSDSEICYAHDLAESTKCANCKDEFSQLSPKKVSLDTTEGINFQVVLTNTPVFDAGVEAEEVFDKPTSLECLFDSEEAETQLRKVPTVEIFNASNKKSVRFADDIGNPLFHEKLITDTALPPFYDFPDLGDLGDLLPGVARPGIKLLGPKHSSMPDIMKVPPPIPRLHHSNSSTGSLNLSVAKSPPSLITQANGTANWRLTFAQPAAQYLAFRQRLESNYVSLENVSIGNRKDHMRNLFLYGTVKVKNIAFEKHVKLRVTYDRWASHKDYPAVHNAQLSSSGGFPSYDAFMFNFCIKDADMPEPREIQLAVCFQAGPNGSSTDYWDNNDGCNYVVAGETMPRISTPLVKDGFFRNHSSKGTRESLLQTAICNIERAPYYTQDYRPNFNLFPSLTSYSSWQHYASESMYY